MRAWFLAIPFLVAACGSSDKAPSPLRYTFDDMHIAAVALDEKQSVIHSKQDYDIAQMERAKAEADYNDSATQLELARNESEKAALTEKSAQTEMKAAEASADMTRRKAAERGRRAVGGKVEFQRARRAWLQKHLRYTQHNAFARQAKWELEKAKVAQARNIRPAGFDVMNYEGQYKERSESAQRARLVADQEKQKAQGKLQEWAAQEKEYAAARGGQGPLESSQASLDGPAPKAP
jgi:hypothetical protein